ncbi:MAG: GAF domain-containing protein, partial [Anaerolineae bacterium]|nr:GAF domain-containing protein [Anaerolineae bacterium]
IRLRDQVIGLIGLESDDPEHTWSEDEVAVLQSIAEQAALSVENARLLAETQRKALREQITGEITTRMRSSLDMETVLRTALNEIAQKLGVTQLEVQLGSQPPASDANAAGFAKRPVSPAGDGRHE